MASPDLQDIHDTLISLAHKAGEMITTAHPSTAGSGSKKNSADLVTETDQAVEDFISSSLRSKYPDYAFMGEETYKPGDRLTDTPTFVVDPIDGTTNFVHSYPYVSISLGLAVKQKPTVGVVYNPFTGVLYSAIKGKGAFKTGQDGKRVQLPVDPEPPALSRLNQALLAIEWGSDRTGHDFRIKSEMFSRLCLSDTEGGAMCHGLRSFGSAALNLCGVAEGGIDVYWESGCWAWDVCAGWVILEEAGGRVVDGNPVEGGGYEGGDWTPRVDARRYMGCRKGVTDELIHEFWGHMSEIGRLSYGPG